MNNPEFFALNKYCYVKNTISKELVDVLSLYTLFDERSDFHDEGPVNPQVPNSHSRYGDLVMESLLFHIQKKIEENTGLELLPTYSYYRVYRKGNELVPHTDREACEISVSVCLGYSYPEGYAGWPLYVDDVPLYMEPGDVAIYRGLEVNHYRLPFDVPDGYYQSQVFLHYVDKNGEYPNLVNDKRPDIGFRH